MNDGVREVEARKNILIGGHSVGSETAKKAIVWQHITVAVNANLIHSDISFTVSLTVSMFAPANQ